MYEEFKIHHTAPLSMLSQSPPFMPRRRSIALAMGSWGFFVVAMAQDVQVAQGLKLQPTQLQDIEIMGHYDNSLGSSESASMGVIGSEVFVSKGLLRPGEILEYVPGMVVTQHSGDGKANQYFLRGMNLDHGTDFASFLNGMPINMPSHAHGQGYTDLNFLIPELVNQIQYKKGPYYADVGDFSSAGSAHVTYRTQLREPFAELTWGAQGYQRAVAANGVTLGDDVHFITALERMNNNGPWTNPEGMRKTNALLSLAQGSKSNGWSSMLSLYQAHWNSTDQVPSRLLEQGQYLGRSFGLFDAVDASDGAKTNRYSLSGQWQQLSSEHLDKINWYGVSSDLNLFSNFTYFTDPLARPYGDQIEQFEKRSVLGGGASRSWLNSGSENAITINTLGFQYRQDWVHVGLNNTAQRMVMQKVRDDQIKQFQIALFAENEFSWAEGIKTITGIRFDHIGLGVNSTLLTENSGSAQSAKLSPKFSLILGPWHKTEFFFNHGAGFHSNDARGVVAKLDPTTKEPVSAVPALSLSVGQELGVKTQIIQNFQSTLSLWRLKFNSELFYQGDTGSTEAGRPSERKGFEMAHHWSPDEHWLIDASFAWTKARYSDSDPMGNFIPNAVDKVVNLTIAARRFREWSGSIGLRYIGPAALIENNTVQSSPSVTTNLRISKKVDPKMDVTLDVLNLFNRHNNDIAYYYNSRVQGETPNGVDDLHLHPAEMRTWRINAKMKF